HRGLEVRILAAALGDVDDLAHERHHAAAVGALQPGAHVVVGRVVLHLLHRLDVVTGDVHLGLHGGGDRLAVALAGVADRGDLLHVGQHLLGDRFAFHSHRTRGGPGGGGGGG